MRFSTNRDRDLVEIELRQDCFVVLVGLDEFLGVRDSDIFQVLKFPLCLGQLKQIKLIGVPDFVQFVLRFHIPHRVFVPGNHGREAFIVEVLGIVVLELAYCIPAHDGINEFLLSCEKLILDLIERTLDGVLDNFDFGNDIPLPENTPVALLHPGRHIGCVEMMNSDKPLLDVHARSEGIRAADDEIGDVRAAHADSRGRSMHADPSGVHILEHLFLVLVFLQLVDALYLVFGNALLDKFSFQFVVGVEINLFGRAVGMPEEVEEYALRSAHVLCLVVPLLDFDSAPRYFAVRVFRKRRTDEAHICRRLCRVGVGDKRNRTRVLLFLAGKMIVPEIGVSEETHEGIHVR